MRKHFTSSKITSSELRLGWRNGRRCWWIGLSCGHSRHLYPKWKASPTRELRELLDRARPPVSAAEVIPHLLPLPREVACFECPRAGQPGGPSLLVRLAREAARPLKKTSRRG